VAKRDLVFTKPLLNSAGMLGFAPDARAPIDWDHLGAFTTNPISLRPRTAAAKPAAVEFPGGFLLHTGLPNPGFRHVVDRCASVWERSALPIIPNLMADRPDETREMVRALEALDGILAVELGFAPLLADELILRALEMSLGELPLIVSLPSEQLLRLGPGAIELGASALSIAPPRGSAAHRGALLSGRLFGPALLPQAMHLVQVAARIGLPIIGGVFEADEASAMLEVGAMAVQIEAGVWLPTPNRKSLVN
jgi:dihydroorotate dehydrogenase (NAD+) catalytic subunit